MKLNSKNGTTLRYGIGLGTLTLALVLVGAIIAGAAAGAVATDTIAVDDPGNQSVDVTLDFSAATNATVALESGETTYDSTTVSGSAGGTQTVTLSAATAPQGNVTLNVTATNETAVSVNQTTLVTERTVSVANATTETVDVDVAYQANGTTDVTVLDDAGTTLLTDSMTYDGSDDDGVLSRSFNDSDGIQSGNLTVTLATSPATAHDSVAVDVSPVNDAQTGGGWVPDVGGISIPAPSVDLVPGGTATLAGGAIVLVLIGAAILGRN
ncbi:hypothetical protein HLRTI_001518 [Halorhabdus tiamatea SARL4B]|uniref:Uncharacterized protein n=1 Tax=Halorhabdus tiamatea SARL4B TaxID=1033806 RepID=F7PFM0_9EURY|nr:hypothetical protein [Halorhabdus tiamatea]ERJ06439.1 hypothetical protein HLRTI_001518 [Halorhabdus tiamatea SARL4B]CCQ34321.1 hypothetical protein HTIA_2209 [Halorhabdus tiamatea SARL4B]